jgi:hypothetical protein
MLAIFTEILLKLTVYDYGYGSWKNVKKNSKYLILRRNYGILLFTEIFTASVSSNSKP